MSTMLQKNQLLENLSKNVNGGGGGEGSPEDMVIMQKLAQIEQRIENRGKTGVEATQQQDSKKMNFMLDMMMQNMLTMQNMMLNMSNMQKET